ncbi:hypothetical protein [Hymenobacter volaticus]|uniref:Uncharacterized protein n=1 Tax=Hymenobacter volaticus TaxID=2932254 RepID=A0ABY4GEH4_9BACT|nr:hypothetical protein [Hymenobacter volaticus]UOQ69151.1 hypothetical protein MUN86_25895 [Hymenobacter volaticus]
MKISSFPILTGLLVGWSVTACTDEAVTPQEEPAASPREFFVLASKDGQRWDTWGTGIYSQAKGEFYVSGSDTTFGVLIRKSLTIAFSLPKGQPLSSAQALPAQWLEVVGGDIINDRYSTAGPTSLPSIRITGLDTVQKIVEGRFEATLRRDKHFTDKAEEMRYTKGSFRVRYQVSAF